MRKINFNFNITILFIVVALVFCQDEGIQAQQTQSIYFTNQIMVNKFEKESMQVETKIK